MVDSPPLHWNLLGFGCTLTDCPSSARERLVSILNACSEPAGTDHWHWHVVTLPDGSFQLQQLDISASLLVPGESSAAFTSLDNLSLAIEFGAVSRLYDHYPVLHAALLYRDGRSVLIIGPKEAGKSTLSTALWLHGWELLADDGAILESDGRWAPVPRRVSLRNGGLGVLGASLEARLLATPSAQRREGGILFHPHEFGRPAPVESVMPDAVVFLARLDAVAEPAQSMLIAPTDALLAGTAYLSTRSRAGFGEALRQLGPLFDAAPAYDLGRGPVDAMVEAVERLSGGATSETGLRSPLRFVAGA